MFEKWLAVSLHLLIPPNPPQIGGNRNQSPPIYRQLSRPDDKIWEAIAKAYNSQSSQQVNFQTLEKWLLNAAKSVRKYCYPASESLNTPKGGDDSWEWLDNLTGS